jgi:hypothetical protein
VRDNQVAVLGFDGDDLGKAPGRVAALLVQRVILLNERNTGVAHRRDDAVLGHPMLPGVSGDPDPLHVSGVD